VRERFLRTRERAEFGLKWASGSNWAGVGLLQTYGLFGVGMGVGQLLKKWFL
jgi:hypothetical protein